MDRGAGNGSTGGSNGHGADMRRGRSASAHAREQLVDAMHRLLELGGARMAGRFVPLDGGTLHYLETGQGSPVVLLQGAGGGAANWYRIFPALGASFRVLAPDLPGFGLSDAVPISLPLGSHAARIVRRWLEALGIDRFDLVGTSFGGLVALRLAQDWPGAVKRLVLLDSVGLGRALPFIVRGAALRPVGRLALAPSLGGTRWQFRVLLTSDRSRIGPEHERALIEYLYWSAAASAPGTMAEALGYFADLRGQRERLSDAELAGIRSPTLVLWGARDRFLPPAHGERAAALIPRSAFHAIPRAGHSPNWEAPDALNRILVPFLAHPSPA